MEIKTKWDEEEKIEKKKKNLGGEKIVNKIGTYSKAIFWVLMVVFIVVGGFVSYFLFQYQKSRELNLEVAAPNRILIAKPFEITVNIENKSQSVLRDPKILIQLPEGAVSPENEIGSQFIEEKIDNVDPGVIIKKSFNLVFIKGEQTTEKINVNFSYLPENLSTRFETNKVAEIFVDQPAISMNLITPQRVFNRENFQISINYQNISDYDFKHTRLQLVYPSNFLFKDASVVPTSGNNIWDLSKAISKSQKNLVINGSLQGVDQSFSEIKTQLFADLNGREYLINEKSASLGIASSPLSLAITANGNANYITTAGDLINYQIKYKNNTDVGLSDVILKVKLTGEMFDFATLQSQGFFDSVNNTIVWNAGNISQFKTLDPNFEGTANFSIKVKPTFSIKRMFDKNFSLKLQAEINSPTVPYNVSSDKTIGFANFETKVSGKADINTSLIYLNGAIPVKVDQPTTMEVHWQIKNYATDIKNIVIGAVLQPGVKWLGVSKSDVETSPVYNERTGEITWAIGRILATKGVISKPVEAVFKIEATPSITQTGQQFTFMGETFLQAIDEFTGVQLNAKTGILKTSENVQ